MHVLVDSHFATENVLGKNIYACRMIHCKFIRKYILSIAFLSVLISSIKTHFKYFKSKQTLPVLPQINSTSDTFNFIYAERSRELKLKAECNLTNHLHIKDFKRKEETLKMAAGKQKSCGNVNFSKTVFPITALVSFPGSGNTWLRHLIQEATGNFFIIVICLVTMYLPILTKLAQKLLKGHQKNFFR